YEAERIYGMLAETKEDRQARRLMEFIRSHGGGITVRGLYRSSPSRYRTPEDAEQVLQGLVDTGLAQWVEKPASAKGGRPSRGIRLSTALTIDKTDKTPEGEDDEGDDPDGGALTEPPPIDKTPGGPAAPSIGPETLRPQPASDANTLMDKACV